MSLSPVGLPAEVKLGALDFSLPPDAKSFTTKIQPSNVSSIVSSTLSTGQLTNADAGTATEYQFPVQNILFDVPTSSPSTFIDTRLSTLNFKMNIELTNAPATAIPHACLRSNANSFFDRHYTVGPNGNILEDINEYGLVSDTLLNLQMSNSDRDGLALMYGFNSADAITSQGINFPLLKQFAAAGNECHSFSVPLLNSLIGVTADKFFNVGRCPKLQLCFQTTGVLPFTISNAGGTALAADGIMEFRVSLYDFSLQLEYVDIGLSALSMLDQTLIDGKAYIHGTTYKTSSVALPAGTSGAQSLLAGVRGSSIKSLFARFFDSLSTREAGSINGKYDSKNPNINSYNFNIGGIRFPNIPINPLNNPANAFSNLQKAIGQFNSSQFNSSIVPSKYCVLSQGGTATGVATTAGTQTYDWISNTTTAVSQASFILGENTEIVAKRGVMSGINASNAPIFLELNIATAPTNAHNVYITAMLDCVYIHDVKTGVIDVRM